MLEDVKGSIKALTSPASINGAAPTSKQSDWRVKRSSKRYRSKNSAASTNSFTKPV